MTSPQVAPTSPALPTTAPVRLAVIIGSTRDGRFGPTVARWFTGRARRRADLAVDVIDLAATPLPANLTHRPDAEESKALGEVTPRLASADAYAVITPEYNHSYPAALKNAIDWHYTQWRAKPVGFVSYGGVSGGLRAVEHLRPVFAELHAVTLRDTVSFHRAGDAFDAEGAPRDSTRPAAAADAMLDQLAWWALTLREGRAARPYAA